MGELKLILNQPKEQELMQKILATEAQFLADQNKILSRLNEMMGDQARTYLVTDSHKTLIEYNKRVNELVDLQSESMNRAGKLATGQYQLARTIVISLTVIALALAMRIALWIIRSITRPLGGEPEEAKVVVERIARGDLTADIKVKTGDTSSLIFSVQVMQASLRMMVGNLKQNAEGVSSAAHQLASTSSKVASATEQQSEAASTMAAAVEEMTVSFTHLSERAHDARSVTAQGR